jgi:hypothetical protein
VYDDNIFLGNGDKDINEDEESDWIFHIKPQLMFNFPLFAQRGTILFGYQGNFAEYADNTDNDWDEQKGLLKLNYNAPGGLIFELNDTYADSDDPYGSENEYLLGERTSRWSNDLKSKLGFRFGDNTRIMAYYNFFKQDYDKTKDDSQDYDSYEVGLGFAMKFLPKTWGFIRYHCGERDYFSHSGLVTSSNDSDFDWHRVNTGVTWDSGAKLSGEVNLGYKWKSYDNGVASNGKQYDDVDTWIAATNIAYMASSTTTLRLNISRAVRESGSDTNEYYKDTGLGVFLEQQLMTRLKLKAGLEYMEHDYNTDDREDDNYRANLDLAYRVQDWLSVGTAYDFKEKDSNRSENDYTDNQLKFYLTGTY